MNLNIVAPICTTGYGIAAYNIVKELDKRHSVTLYPISNQMEFDDQFLCDAVDRQQNPNLNSPTVKIWHQNQQQESVGHGEHIGFPIFELDTFTEYEKASLRHCDRLFVCSQWAKDVVLNNLTELSKDRVHVIPLGVDSSLFSSAKQTSRKNTIFFNCGKWEYRKGHDVLLEAFNRAFSPSDDVELWMLCDNPFIGQDGNNAWRSSYIGSVMGQSRKIRMIPRQKTHEDVYNIMRQTDCGVFPARAEGWNLELLEMMACGKEVIATNYSAHTEFCNQDNCRLIEIEEEEEADDGVWFHGQGNWAKITDKNIDAIAEHMRDVHKRKQANDLSPNVDGVFTANKYSWKNTAKEIINAIC